MPTQPISGLYRWSDPSGVPFDREELRLDVDGHYALMAASGTAFGLEEPLHWVAPKLKFNTSTNSYSGGIELRYGPVAHFQYTDVTLRFDMGTLVGTFTAAGQIGRERRYQLLSSYFRNVEFEFDVQEGLAVSSEYDTHSHPNRPETLAAEKLTIENVFERAGFRVTSTRGSTPIPISGSQVNNKAGWSDAELNDAMVVHYSRLAILPWSQRNLPAWALWTFFASQHEDASLGGQMFDKVGPGQRQGTAVFLNSFISQPPSDDARKDEWVRRMVFCTAIHEMGHGFNLEHSWARATTRWRTPKESGYGVASFMNYPSRFGGNGLDNDNARANVINYFSKFEFRFTWDELLFLRHAPEPFVQMGNESFGTNHALEFVELSPAPNFQLELRTNREPIRDTAEFGFMEPVVVELKLKNISGEPQLIPQDVLDDADHLTLVVRKRLGSPRAFEPFVHYLRLQKKTVLMPGDAVYASWFVSAGSKDWIIAEPGYYEIQACLHLPTENVLSTPLTVRVVPPRSWDEEYVAQDFFSRDVARTLTFDGSRTLDKANDVLRDVMNKFPRHRVALHAQMALGLPETANYKLLQSASDRYRIEQFSPSQTVVEQLMKSLIKSTKQAGKSSDVLGNIDFFFYAERISDALVEVGQVEKAKKLLQRLNEAGNQRNILKSVTKAIRAKLRRISRKKDR